MVEVPKDESEDKKTIQGSFSQEFYMGKGEVAALLRNLADEIERGNELTIKTEEWELPFMFRDEVEVEVELDNDKELEIELEFERGSESKISVE